MDAITMNLTKEVVEYHIKYFFGNSLRFYPEKYINLVLNHHQIIPKHVAYLCPLCTQNWLFFTSSALKCSAEFNEDHYPPQNSGGTKTILTCKPCNSTAGHQYDFALEKHLDLLSYNRRIPNSTMPMRHRLDGLPKFMNGKIVLNNEGELILHLKKKDSDKIKPLDEWLANNKGSKEWKFEIQPKDPDMKKVHQALLHAAYLFCFEVFGYEFVFSKAGELMRNVFNNTATYPVDITDLTLDQPEQLNKLPIGVCFIIKPKILQSLAVNIELVNKTTGYKTIHTVLIPNPIESGIDTLKAQGLIFKGFVGDIEMVLLSNYIQSGFPNAYTKMWQDLQRDYSNIQ